MKRRLAGVIAVLALVLAGLFPAAPAALAGDMMVTQAFARASATPGAKAGAAYVSLMNHGASDRLIAARSPASKTVEIHTSEMVDGVMKMTLAAPIDIPMHGMLEMKPGGYHLMLMGLTAPLVKDQAIEITLVFEKAGELTVTVPVGAVAANTDGHDHGSGADSGG